MSHPPVRPPSPRPPSPRLLRAEALQKAYQGRQVIRGVSMQITAGEVVGLLGPNGAGKTTCFYMLVGLVPPDAGRIWLDGRDISALPIHHRARQGLSYLPQEASIFRRLSVADNIRAVLELQTNPEGGRLGQPEITGRLEALLSELQIAHIAGQLGQTLSGGERRRVEIARALATSPRFILLDEPFAGVDPIAVIELQRIIGFLRDKGIGVLITDHNVRETLGICDHATIIHNGEVLAEGRPEDIVEDESVREVYLGAHFSL